MAPPTMPRTRSTLKVATQMAIPTNHLGFVVVRRLLATLEDRLSADGSGNGNGKVVGLAPTGFEALARSNGTYSGRAKIDLTMMSAYDPLCRIVYAASAGAGRPPPR
jgi:hypothetical protein